MKRNLLKNMFTSICVTTFIVMILLVIYELVFDRIFVENILNNTEQYIQDQGIEDSLKEDLKSFDEENGVVEYQKKILVIYSKSKEIVCYEIIYALVVSAVIGSIVGYLKVIMESRQDRNAVLKKVVLGYFAGLAIVAAATGLIGIIARGGIDFEAMGLYIFVYTIIYTASFVIKMGRDNKKKNELNELMKKDK
jgi:hypothetical protein